MTKGKKRVEIVTVTRTQFGRVPHKSWPAVYSLQQWPFPLLPAVGFQGAMSIGMSVG